LYIIGIATLSAARSGHFAHKYCYAKDVVTFVHHSGTYSPCHR